MEVTPFQPHVRAADLPLEKLAGNSNITEKEKVGEVSRQFEAVLLRQILSDAQKPVFGTKTASVANSIYQDQATNQMADQLSRAGGLGFAQSLRQELGHELKIGQGKSAAQTAAAGREFNARPAVQHPSDAAHPFQKVPARAKSHHAGKRAGRKDYEA